MTVIETIRAARRVGTPLVAVETADQQAFESALFTGINGGAPKFHWDCLSGLRPASAEAQELLSDAQELDALAVIGWMLGTDENGSDNLPPGSLVVVHNFHLFIDNPHVIQGICNLRDQLKSNRRTVVMLAPSWKLPAEWRQDVMLLSEDLPSDETLHTIVQEAYTTAQQAGAEITEPTPAVLKQAITALHGLSFFAAETAVWQSMSKIGLSLDTLRERTYATINQIDGLEVLDTSHGVDCLSTAAAVDTFVEPLMDGEDAIQLVLFIDEMEKMFAGATGASAGDQSGVSQDQEAVFLSNMQDSDAFGISFVGHPGTGKTETAKAIARKYGCIALKVDPGAMKGQYVGESERRVREVWKVINSIAGRGQVLVIATLNKLDILSPAMQRRFRFTFMFDLPGKKEREMIWSLHIAKRGLDPAAPRPSDEGWTGADIADCCRIAGRRRRGLVEAANFVTPISRRDPEGIRRLRQIAHNTFLDSARPGNYTMPESKAPSTRSAGRTLSMDD